MMFLPAISIPIYISSSPTFLLIKFCIYIQLNKVMINSPGPLFPQCWSSSSVFHSKVLLPGYHTNCSTNEVAQHIHVVEVYPPFFLNWFVHLAVLVYCWLQNLHHYVTSIWNQCNFLILSASFGWFFFDITYAVLRYWNTNCSFLILQLLLCFPCLITICMEHFNCMIWQGFKQFS